MLIFLFFQFLLNQVHLVNNRISFYQLCTLFVRLITQSKKSNSTKPLSTYCKLECFHVRYSSKKDLKWFKGWCSFLRLLELFITIVVITKTKILIMVAVKIKKILKNTYSLLKNSFQRKTHFLRKPATWFVSQIEWLVSLWCKSNDWFLRFFSKDFKF